MGLLSLLHTVWLLIHLSHNYKVNDESLESCCTEFDAVVLCSPHTHTCSIWCVPPWPSAALSSSPRVPACFLESPPGSLLGDTATPLARTCAISVELGYLCNLCKVQVLPHGTSSDSDNSQMENFQKQQPGKTRRKRTSPVKAFLH